MGKSLIFFYNVDCAFMIFLYSLPNMHLLVFKIIITRRGIEP
jgi:hypothetical protein